MFPQLDPLSWQAGCAGALLACLTASSDVELMRWAAKALESLCTGDQGVFSEPAAEVGLQPGEVTPSCLGNLGSLDRIFLRKCWESFQDLMDGHDFEGFSRFEWPFMSLPRFQAHPN